MRVEHYPDRVVVTWPDGTQHVHLCLRPHAEPLLTRPELDPVAATQGPDFKPGDAYWKVWPVLGWADQSRRLAAIVDGEGRQRAQPRSVVDHINKVVDTDR